ncbi:hypothetical protein [Agromyces sp. SYSU T00194]|uniref:hypothetical protein n=1 Tax=Agromyces chitinivorans TaxID=3158560 RepID=UPI003391AA29
MTDQTWHPPTGPGTGSNPAGTSGPPPAGGPAGAAPTGPEAGWTPPPRPGLVPLRPLGFATLLGAPFQTIRRNPGPTFGSGLLVQVVVTLATVALVFPVMFGLIDRLERASADDLDAIASGGAAGFLLLMLVPIALSVIGSAFLQGIMVVDVASGTLGERLRFAEVWRRAARRIGPLIGWVLLVAAAVGVITVLLVGIVLGFALIEPVLVFVGVAIALVLGLGIAVLAAWTYTKLSLTPSAIVLERRGVFSAMARSWRLTDGHFWRIFGVELLVAFIVNTAAQVVVQPISFVGGLASFLIDPTGTGTGLAVLVATYVVAIGLSLVVGAVAAVAQSAVVALLYLDLRMRREGLDLELQRVVELRRTGARVADPFAP